MKISFEGIGQWAATFACAGVQEGDLVKVSGNGSVGLCSAGDAFCGQTISLGRGGDACAVQLGGFITADYTGDTAPTAGWCKLSADGSGGVKVDSTGRNYLVVDADTTAKVVVFAL
ncbi:hypothetical protein [Oscillibacter ruminantium]|uniref:hypothetical protein n=1 Tax=Oscillibacter ruminantium TaxID=1263547 RepID=UPI0033344EC1